MRLRLISVLLVAALGGCAEFTSIYHSRRIAPDQAITVDAYQRSTYVSRVPGDASGQIRLCAEASPDTFAALSASLAAEGDAASKSASLAAAFAQSGATIERTQTINLLRESMYRTCERYLSGAITKETLIVQAARDQRAMVAVLAIEQLTRTARPASTVVSAGSTSATVPNSAYYNLITNLRDDEQRAQAEVVSDQNAYAAAGGPANCANPRPADDTGTPTQAQWDACNTAKNELAQSQARLATATTRVNDAVAAGGGGGGDDSNGAPPVNQASTGTGPNNAGGGGAPLSDTTIANVADAVRDIANAPGIDESLMFCIGYLSRDPAGSAAAVRVPEVTAMCLDIIKDRAAADNVIRSGKSTLGATSPGGVAAGRVLADYLTAPDDAVERGRRWMLVRQAATTLGLSDTSRPAINRLLISGDAGLRARLLDGVKAIETDPAGKTALGATN